jgi:hypothetical protein
MPLARELLTRTIHQIVSQFSPRGEGDAPEAVNTLYRIAEHQRHYIWPLLLQSTLIDSVMKGYPIPSIQLIRCVEISMFYNIEDGQQRITTLHRYMKDLFEADINGTQKKFSQLTDEERMHFLTYPIQCDIYNEDDITLDDRIAIFHRINSSKPLTDNQKFHSRLYSTQGQCLAWFLDNYSVEVHKYFGSIGKGKSRSGISDLIGAIVSLQRSDRSSLTTSYLKNSQYMDMARDNESITEFFDAYFQVLEREVESKTHRCPKSYGKLSGPLGLAVCSWITRDEIHDAVYWYIGKRVDKRTYVPSSFRTLTVGDQRNCQGDSIINRLEKVIEQFERDPADEGDSNEEEDE